MKFESNQKFVLLMFLFITIISIIACINFKIELDKTQDLIAEKEDNLNNIISQLNNLELLYQKKVNNTIEIMRSILKQHYLGFWMWKSIDPSELSIYYQESFIIIAPSNLVPDENAFAILNICKKAEMYLKINYGFKQVQPILIIVTQSASEALYCNLLYNYIHLQILNKNTLVNYEHPFIWGFIHEVSHFYFPFYDEFTEGCAIYGAVKLYPNVLASLGDSAWPVMDNVSKFHNDLVLENILTSQESTYRAARIVYLIEDYFGSETIGKAVIECLNIYDPKWKDLQYALINLTNESEYIYNIFSTNGYK